MIDEIRRLKLEIMSRGLGVDPVARDALWATSPAGIMDADYATTSGLTLVLPGNMYVNAPVDEWYCDSPAVQLRWSSLQRGFVAHTATLEIDVQVLPLPRYLATGDSIFDGVRTHADRVRVSPIAGCASACLFCASHRSDYGVRDAESLAAGLRCAVKDKSLPARHALVSGGTPLLKDRIILDGIYRRLLAESPVPVDVMLMPRESTEVIDMLVEDGVDGLAINLELYTETAAAYFCPQKGALGIEGYATTIKRAVDVTGGHGRVRSLLLVGLESPEATLQGVEFLASLGADPVLSPFRPAPGTPTANLRPPSADMMEQLYESAAEIAERYNVRLGPRCEPCQHNTLTFPNVQGEE